VGVIAVVGAGAAAGLSVGWGEIGFDSATGVSTLAAGGFATGFSREGAVGVAASASLEVFWVEGVAGVAGVDGVECGCSGGVSVDAATLRAVGFGFSGPTPGGGAAVSSRVGGWKEDTLFAAFCAARAVSSASWFVGGKDDFLNPTFCCEEVSVGSSVAGEKDIFLGWDLLSWGGACFSEDGEGVSGLFCSESATEALYPPFAVELSGKATDFLNAEGFGNSLLVSGSIAAAFFGATPGTVAGAPAGLGAIGLGLACGGDIVAAAVSLVGFAGGGFSAADGISAARAALAFANWDVLSEVSGFAGGGFSAADGISAARAALAFANWDVLSEASGFAGGWFSAAEGISAARAALAFANWDVPSEVSEEEFSRATLGGFLAAAAGGALSLASIGQCILNT
jgi:hypothetical protein